MASIVLIDDKRDLLDELVSAVSALLAPEEATVRTWIPTSEEKDPSAAFGELVDADTILVVTDYDLTGRGRTGLFGSTIVGWCQARAIPVGDYSRGNTGNLPKQSNLFDMRVPSSSADAAQFIVSVFRGFRRIRNELGEALWVHEKRSPAAVLATLLGVPSMESQFSLYGARLGSNAALLDQLATEGSPSSARLAALLAYIIGHLLVNSVLRFPGPILSGRALAAYAGCAETEGPVLNELFAAARYAGPFAGLGEYFWLTRVDDILKPMLALIPGDFAADSRGHWNRTAIEAKVGRRVARHECTRCGGNNGGFLCPLTGKTVCELASCSVGSNSWIPQGARLCRIERDFYDEWAPILGF